MIKKTKPVLFAGIILAIALFIAISTRNINEASAIGIIGGADGPTAIFLASKISPFHLTLYIVKLVVIVFAIIYVIKEIKSNKNKKFD